MVFNGLGDHMLDHMSHALYTFRFSRWRVKEKGIRPLAIEDLL